MGGGWISVNLGGGELTFIAVILLMFGLGIYGISRLSGTRSKDSGGGSRDTSERDAGVGRRCVAYLIDLALICVPLILGGTALQMLVTDRKTLSSVQNVLGWAIGVPLYASYFIGLWMRGGTVGQRLLGLAVVGSDGPITFRQALSRLIALVVVQSFLLAPVVLIVFLIYRLLGRPFWHDTVSGTRVTPRRAMA